jgi:hypothetical protein
MLQPSVIGGSGPEHGMVHLRSTHDRAVNLLTRNHRRQRQGRSRRGEDTRYRARRSRGDRALHRERLSVTSSDHRAGCTPGQCCCTCCSQGWSDLRCIPGSREVACGISCIPSDESFRMCDQLVGKSLPTGGIGGYELFGGQSCSGMDETCVILRCDPIGAQTSFRHQ